MRIHEGESEREVEIQARHCAPIYVYLYIGKVFSTVAVVSFVPFLLPFFFFYYYHYYYRFYIYIYTYTYDNYCNRDVFSVGFRFCSFIFVREPFYLYYYRVRYVSYIYTYIYTHTPFFFLPFNIRLYLDGSISRSANNADHRAKYRSSKQSALFRVTFALK